MELMKTRRSDHPTVRSANALGLRLRLIAMTLCMSACTFAPSEAWADITLGTQTISDTLVIPIGEAANLINSTITLDNGVLDVSGRLISKNGPILFQGTGQVILRDPDSVWGYVSTNFNPPSLEIGPGIELLGEHNTVFSTLPTTNNGTIAAIPGGILDDQFFIHTRGLTNNGLLEARDGGLLRLSLNAFTSSTLNPFVNNGVIRANSGGRIEVSQAFPRTLTYTLDELGTIENLGGKVRLNFNLDNAGKTTTLTGGAWALYRDAEVQGGVIDTASGGGLAIEQYERFGYRGTEFSTLRGVTLNTDLTSLSRSRAMLADGVTLNGQWKLRGEVMFDGAETLTGTGGFVADQFGGTLRAGDRVTFADTIGVRSSNGGLIDFIPDNGSPNPAVFELNGQTLADGGTLEVKSGVTVENNGDISVGAGGRFRVRLGATLSNHGTFQVNPDGILDLHGAIVNDGSIAMDQGYVIVRDVDITNTGSMTVDRSLILSGQYVTASQMQSIPGTTNDHASYTGTIDLEGQTITISDVDGQRWSIAGGGFTTGTINSADGFELQTIVLPDPLSPSSWAVLSDLELNANLRVGVGPRVQVDGSVTGTGSFIVDGGELDLEPGYMGSVGPKIFDRIVPLNGIVRIAGQVDNTGNTIRLRSGVEWRLKLIREAGIIGGRIEADPGVELLVEQGYGYGYGDLVGVTLAAPTRLLPRSGSLHIVDGLTLDQASVTIGTPLPGDQFADARLIFLGEQTLDGVGEILFNAIDGFPSNATRPRINMIEVAPASGAPEDIGLTIGAGITIRSAFGSGYIGGNYFYQLAPESVPLVNHGAIIAENGNTITVYAQTLEQHGTLRAGPASSLILHEVNGTNAGRFDLTGGTIKLVGSTYDNFGTIAGSGTLDVTETVFVNHGVVSPGQSAGQSAGELVIAGDFAQGTGGVIDLEIGGFVAGDEYDVLHLTDTGLLGGTLRLSFIDGFSPSAGSFFGIITTEGGPITGEFEAVEIFSPGYRIDIDLLYGSTVVIAEVLSVVPLPIGDLDGDGFVGIGDLNLVLASWNLSSPAAAPRADPTGDGFVGIEDLTAVLGNWNAGLPLPPQVGSSVPEPGTLGLSGLGCLFLTARSRRSRRAGLTS